MKHFRILTKMFYCGLEREEYHDYREISAKAALVQLVAEFKFGDLPSEESLTMANTYIEENLGVDWTVDTFLSSALEIWESDDLPGYIAHYIEEVQNATL